MVLIFVWLLRGSSPGTMNTATLYFFCIPAFHQKGNQPQKLKSPKHWCIKERSECTATYHNPPKPQTALRFTILHLIIT